MGEDPQAAPPPLPQRWVGVGHATDGDPVAAAAHAVDQALVAAQPRLLLAFAAAGYDLPVLAAALRAAAPDVPLVGCTTAGELTARGLHHGTLVVVALGGPGFSVSTVAIPGAGGDLRDAGVQAAAALGDVADRPYQALLLLSDALAGDQHELVRGAYSIAGAGVPLIGACAGGGIGLRRGGQLHDGAALGGAVVAAAIGSDAPLGVGVGHGWRAGGEPVHVTRTEGADLLTLDGRPALDVYLERAGASRGLAGDPIAFARFAHEHPLGMRRRAGEEHVRIVLAADPARRSLRTAAELPQGGLAWLMARDPAAAGVAGARACADAVDRVRGRPPLGLIGFGAVPEPAFAAAAATGACVAGFSGEGEFARARGVLGFHNHALAVLAVA